MRLAVAVLVVWFALTPAAAMVGGAPPAGEAGRAVLLMVGSRGTSCSAVALARDLILTAGHCVLPGADYKLVEFGPARQPLLKDIASIVRHPEFDVNAVLRHRVTADVALLKPAASLANEPAPLAPPGSAVAAGDRLVVAGYGLATPGDGRSGGILRSATLVATGQPGTLQIRLVDPATNGERAGLGACTGDSGAPVFRATAGALAVIGVVSWSTGAKNRDGNRDGNREGQRDGYSEGCGGLTGVTPLVRYRDWIAQSAAGLGSPLP